MDFRSPPSSDGCPIDEMDILHLFLFMLHRRVSICRSLNLDCIDLPLLATTPLLARNCERESVYRLIRKLRKMLEKLGGEVEIFRHGGITASLRFSFEKGNIYVHDGIIVAKKDCAKVNCILVNNVSLVFMYLAVKLSERNLAILNVPDALVWLSKMTGAEMVDAVLSLIHDYVETEKFDDNVNELISLISMWGIPMDAESLNNAVLPAKRSLTALRQQALPK